MKGFSLIELLVVVAIIAILASVAIPFYSMNRSRATFNSLMMIMRSYLESVEKTYSATGVMPTSINIEGNSAPNQNWVAVSNITGLAYVYYYVSPDNKGAGIGMAVNPAQLPGFQNLGNKVGFAIGFRDNNGTVQYACGSTAGDTNALPQAYFPSGCHCLSMGAAGGANQFVQGGATC